MVLLHVPLASRCLHGAGLLSTSDNTLRVMLWSAVLVRCSLHLLLAHTTVYGWCAATQQCRQAPWRHLRQHRTKQKLSNKAHHSPHHHGRASIAFAAARLAITAGLAVTSCCITLTATAPHPAALLELYAPTDVKPPPRAISSAIVAAVQCHTGSEAGAATKHIEGMRRGLAAGPCRARMGVQTLLLLLLCTATTKTQRQYDTEPQRG